MHTGVSSSWVVWHVCFERYTRVLMEASLEFPIHFLKIYSKLIEHFRLFEFKVQQIVTGPILASARPAQGGDSLGYGTSVSATGTFGCLVKNAAGDTFILSCNH